MCLHCAANFQCELKVFANHTLDFGCFIDIAIGQRVIVGTSDLKGLRIEINIARLFDCTFYVYWLGPLSPSTS